VADVNGRSARRRPAWSPIHWPNAVITGPEVPVDTEQIE